ncbi:hypothetical protein P3L10_032360 [Capsicum annuum]
MSTRMKGATKAMIAMNKHLGSCYKANDSFKIRQSDQTIPEALITVGLEGHFIGPKDAFMPIDIHFF